ncbi:MAG: ACT domain-containing protein [Pseudomonadota bacterium]|nr:ACT domain-containing protein [Pseudomonadota bacterium]
MTATLLLTVIGPNRPGLVESLSRTVADHGGNWLDSRMANLAGYFTGMVLVGIAGDNVAALARALDDLAGQGLRVTVERGLPPAAGRQDRVLHLELVGQDRPGIVRDVARTLAALNIDVDELHTQVTEASWTGEALFHASAELHVPQDISTERLRRALEGLANELMVDIRLEDLPP